MSTCIRKCQSGLEFMLLCVFLLLIISSFYTVINRNSSELTEYRRNYLASSIAEKIAYEINIAVTSGDGYMKEFYIPPDIYGYDYNITFSRKSVFVDWWGNSQAAYVIISNVTGEFVRGYNYIGNEDGQIYLNPTSTQVPVVTVSVIPSYPKPDDNISLSIIADDSKNGDNDIYGCYLSSDMAVWTYVGADDGTYDESYETATADIGNKPTGLYTYYAKCNDTGGYMGERETEFSVSTHGSLWWNTAWPYRIAVNVTGSSYMRWNYPVHVRVNFTQLISDAGDAHDFDNNSIRVVEWDDVPELNFETSVNYKEITVVDMFYPDLWDMAADVATKSVDFTSGLNQTGNSFGVLAADDGWDWTNTSVLAPYGHNAAQANYFAYFGDPDGDSDYDTGSGSGILRPDLPTDSDYISVIIGNQADDPNTGDDILDSGAWGIKFYIDSQMYTALQEGGKAVLSFDYYADDADDDLEEGAWIKARFGNSTAMNYLGSDLDSGRAYSDATPEIWASVDNPGGGWNNLVSGVFESDVTGYVTGAGWYYLDFGAKVDWIGGVHGAREGLAAYFDNIELKIKRERSIYNKTANAAVDVYWLMNGSTNVSQVRNYYIYFSSENSSKNASTLLMNYDVQYFHIGYYQTNTTKMENVLSSLKSGRWISDWSRTNTGSDSPNLKKNNVAAGKNVVILGQSDSPRFNLDSWISQNGNMLVIFSPSRGLVTDLPISGYSSSNHQQYDDLANTVYTDKIEAELSRNSMSFGYIDQGDSGIHTASCVEADEGDNQVMLSACDYKGSFISFSNYPSTSSEMSSYPSAPENILQRYIWKLLFEKHNPPVFSTGSVEMYGG